VGGIKNFIKEFIINFQKMATPPVISLGQYASDFNMYHMRRVCFGANGKNSDPPWYFKPDDQRILRREDKATIQNSRLGIAKMQ
jgi:hypothetical protein